MKQIKAVIFDYGGVLSTEQVRPEVEAMLDLLRVEESRFHHWYYYYRPSYDLGSTGEDFWRQVLRACDVKYNPDLVAKLITHDVRSWTQLDPAMLKWVSRLKQEGYKLGIISNMVKEILAHMRENFPWLKQNLFDSQIFSCDWQVSKPDERIYRICLERIGLQPEDCLFLDDTEINIKAAQELGFNVFHYGGPADLKVLQERFSFTIE